MEQVGFGEIPTTTKINLWSREEINSRYGILESEYHRALKEIYRLKNQNLTDEQLKIFMQERIDEMAGSLFGTSSEKYKKSEKPKKDSSLAPKPRIKKPSERYPNLPVREVVLKMEPLPSCKSCGTEMSDSGMRESAQQLTVIPKKYEIIENQRVIYRCSCCHGDLKTAPSPARIMDGSSFSDEMMIDVGLSKYCDLIPVERYAAMAARSGVKDLPPQSLIECTHYLADFLIDVYLKLKRDILLPSVVAADETPHNMLEGSDKKSWYLWGFSTPTTCYFECHDTRSADVASEILQYANCTVLLTDVYTGYGKAVRDANKVRRRFERPEIKNAYCSAHARRYFFKALVSYPDAIFYLDRYSEIYKLNEMSKGKAAGEILELRNQMLPHFAEMKAQAQRDIFTTPEKGKHGKAIRYLLGNYEGLTLCLENPEVPIDNNAQERLLRSPVVGRKTWYGTHSERGARTAAILFSIVESCKLTSVNPREYIPAVVEMIKIKRTGITPHEYGLQCRGSAPKTAEHV